MENIELSRGNPPLDIIVLSVWVLTICYVWEQKRVLEWHPLWIEIQDFLQATIMFFEFFRMVTSLRFS